MTTQDYTPGRSFTYVLPGVTRPLSANELNGGHWARGARLRSLWRQYGRIAWLANGKPRYDQFTVALQYVPRDARTRDVENLFAAQKCIVDGLVHGGEGITVDDSPAYYSTTIPTVHAPDRTKKSGRVWIVVTELIREEP